MSQYPKLEVRLDQRTKDEFAELAKLRGTTPSALVKTFIQGEITSLPREKRRVTSDLSFLD